VSREGQIASLSLDSLSDRELQRCVRRVQADGLFIGLGENVG
jgi:hypothetical protein